MYPFPPIIETLQPLFELEKPRAIDGKYIYTEIQHLKETTDKYHQEPSQNNFLALKKAIRGSMNYIEKWKLNFEHIKNALDNEAEVHGMPPINWPKLLSGSQASPRFQFSALNHAPGDESLLEWIAEKGGKSNDELTYAELAQLLVEHRVEKGFSKKLGQHLRDEPDFLFNLIMKSEKIFAKIAPSPLILYLNDEQLAQAIIKYTPELDKDEGISFEQVDFLIEKFNNHLSHGRSISTILRNANAKAVLDTSAVFQVYQSDEFANREMYSPDSLRHEQETSLKPIF
jgi:hypothetical protein